MLKRLIKQGENQFVPFGYQIKENLEKHLHTVNDLGIK